jgi:hypothetical protein
MTSPSRAERAKETRRRLWDQAIRGRGGGDWVLLDDEPDDISVSPSRAAAVHGFVAVPRADAVAVPRADAPCGRRCGATPSITQAGTGALRPIGREAMSGCKPQLGGARLGRSGVIAPPECGVANSPRAALGRGFGDLAIGAMRPRR